MFVALLIINSLKWEDNISGGREYCFTVLILNGVLQNVFPRLEKFVLALFKKFKNSCNSLKYSSQWVWVYLFRFL